MNNRVKIVTIILLVIIVNALGLSLKYYKLDAYIIFIGFRFYLSLALPFILIYRNSYLGKIKQIVLHPEYNKTFQPLLWILLPLVLILASLFFTKQVAVGDPDYFYEFGLSSIFDYPIYIIWNMPQLVNVCNFLSFHSAGSQV